MTGSYSGRFSIKSICVLLCVLIGFSFALQFLGTNDVYAADNGMSAWVQNDDNPDHKVIGFNFWGIKDGDSVDVSFSVSKYDFSINSKSKGITINS